MPREARLRRTDDGHPEIAEARSVATRDVRRRLVFRAVDGLSPSRVQLVHQAVTGAGGRLAAFLEVGRALASRLDATTVATGGFAPTESDV